MKRFAAFILAAGMLLCFLVGLGGLALAAAAWYWTHCPWELYGW